MSSRNHICWVRVAAAKYLFDEKNVKIERSYQIEPVQMLKNIILRNVR